MFIDTLKTERYRADGKKLASEAASMVNSFGSHDAELEEIMDDIRTEGPFRCLASAFIQALAYNWEMDWMHDGRNEQACRVADALVKYKGFSQIAGMTSWTKEANDLALASPARFREKYKNTGFDGGPDQSVVFAAYMSIEHRTLQQSFAELAFKCASMMFEACGDHGIDSYMEEQGFGSDWTRMPLI